MNKLVVVLGMLAVPFVMTVPAVLVPRIILFAIFLADIIVLGPPSIIFIDPVTTILIALVGAFFANNGSTGGQFFTLAL